MVTWFVSLLLIVVTGPAWAGSTYRYEDPDGIVHYTNVPSDPRYQFLRREAKPTPSSGPPGVSPRGVGSFAQAIRVAADRYGVDPRLVEAVVRVESAGNPGAVSPKGAQGLMQLMPQRAALLGVRNPFDPEQNLDGGVRHLKELLEHFAGDLTLALAAYNAGEAAVRSYQGVPPYAETREYVRRIRALYDGRGLLAATGAALTLAPQRIYRGVTDDGTLTFTNVPPRAGGAPARSF